MGFSVRTCAPASRESMMCWKCRVWGVLISTASGRTCASISVWEAKRGRPATVGFRVTRLSMLAAEGSTRATTSTSSERFSTRRLTWPDMLPPQPMMAMRILGLVTRAPWLYASAGDGVREEGGELDGGEALGLALRD